MPDLTNARGSFNQRVNEAETVVSNVEALWQTAPRGSDVRRQIREVELNALYEMSYLSIFGYWEGFIEECLTRMLAGQGCAAYVPVLTAPPKSPTLKAARVRVLDGRQFLLWYDPARSADRVAGHVTDSPLEDMLRTEQTQLEQFASVRHAIAHRSDDARAAFRQTSTDLTGVAHGSPGALLRTQDHSDPLNPVRWIRKISSELRILAANATG